MLVLNPVMGGKKLPALTTPATAAQILTGYQAIDGAGEMMTGTMEPGMKFASGSITVRSDGSTIKTGFRPSYIMMRLHSEGYYGAVVWSEDAGYTGGYAFSFSPTSDSGGPSSSGDVGDGRIYYAKSFITNISGTGFTLKVLGMGYSSVTAYYYAFG